LRRGGQEASVPGHDIVVVGASAGGVEALVKLVRGLPADLPATLFVVLHVPAHGTSVLPKILDRAGPLMAAHATEGDEICPGRVYVAPPDHHLLVQRGRVRVVRGPRENGHRPAIDPLFRTAARWYGRRAIGVVLSGTLDDGTAGLAAIKRRGGIAIVQHPDDALFTGMPGNALENVEIDHCAAASEIGAILAELARQPVSREGEAPASEDMQREVEIAEFDLDPIESDGHPGTISGFSCPECKGALWELRDGKLTRFRCRVGHAYSSETLLDEQAAGLETALWTAFRALEERAALARRLLDRAKAGGHNYAVTRFAEQARDAEERAAVVRQALLNGERVGKEEAPAV
jgi:two-component system, chemotaxis family, protein-glutamate methylesterase/glutaminase